MSATVHSSLAPVNDGRQRKSMVQGSREWPVMTRVFAGLRALSGRWAASRSVASAKTQRLAADAAHPQVLTGFGHLVEPFDDGAEDIAGNPTLVTVDQQIVPPVEQREVDDRACGSSARGVLVPIRRIAQIVGVEREPA